MSLELIIGCMYSGKSSEIIKRVNQLKSIDKSYIIYNSVIDTRYGGLGIYTHNKTHEPCKLIDNLLHQLNCEDFKMADTIFIDEAQFFTDLKEFIIKAVETYNKTVVVIGLDGDSNRNNFGKLHELLPLCDKITKLTALCSLCKDGTPGIFSKKINNSVEQIDIGSSDKYMAVCRLCYLK